MFPLVVERMSSAGFVFQSLSGLTDEFVDSQYEQLFYPGIATYSDGFRLLLQSLCERVAANRGVSASVCPFLLQGDTAVIAPDRFRVFLCAET